MCVYKKHRPGHVSSAAPAAPATKINDKQVQSAALAMKTTTHLVKMSQTYCACHAKRLSTRPRTRLNKCHEVPPLQNFPWARPYERANGCERLRTVANVCERLQAVGSGCEPLQAVASGYERLRTVADGCGWLRTDADATSSEHTVNPQTPTTYPYRALTLPQSLTTRIPLGMIRKG